MLLYSIVHTLDPFCGGFGGVWRCLSYLDPFHIYLDPSSVYLDLFRVYKVHLHQ